MSAATVIETEAAPPKRRIVLLLIGLLAIVAVGGGIVWFFVLSGDADDAVTEVVEGEIVALEPQTTTLGEEKLHHARVGIGVVLVSGVDATTVTPKAPLLQDALLRELATMNADEVRSSDGSDQLRRQLSDDARRIWGEDVVVRIVLTELLVQ